MKKVAPLWLLVWYFYHKHMKHTTKTKNENKQNYEDFNYEI